MFAFLATSSAMQKVENHLCILSSALATSARETIHWSAGVYKHHWFLNNKQPEPRRCEPISHAVSFLAMANTLRASCTYSAALVKSPPSASVIFSQCTKSPSTNDHASCSVCSFTQRTYSASAQPWSACGRDMGDRTRMW